VQYNGMRNLYAPRMLRPCDKDCFLQKINYESWWFQKMVRMFERVLAFRSRHFSMKEDWLSDLDPFLYFKLFDGR